MYVALTSKAKALFCRNLILGQPHMPKHKAQLHDNGVNTNFVTVVICKGSEKINMFIIVTSLLFYFIIPKHVSSRVFIHFKSI